MGRVKEITEKQSAPKLDVDASKRFLRNALWDAAHKKTPAQEEPKTKKSIDLLSIDMVPFFRIKPKDLICRVLNLYL
jgi:hypothetical protein